MKLCIYQELCNHYTNGSKRKVHHIRITEPCSHWLAMDCKKIEELIVLREFTTGEVTACSTAKHESLMRQLKLINSREG